MALLLTAAALWLESPFLASMQLVAVFLASLIWLADFVARLGTGHFLTRWTHYMFRPDVPLVIRALSLYHAWLPFLLLWAVRQLGYDRRAWLAQTALTWLVLPICFFFTDPARALNGATLAIYDKEPIALLMVAYPLCVYLPSHLLLRQCFRGKPCVNDHAELAPGESDRAAAGDKT